MKTDELIVQLAGEARPVRLLATPSARLMRWLVLAIPVTAVAVVVIHPRPDLTDALGDAAYLTRAVTTVATAVLAAAIALVLCVPGREPSSYRRTLPFLAGAAWALVLGILLASGGHSIERLMALPINPACIYQIAALSFAPAITLFAMLKHAAPLQPAWNALLASLAALAVGGVGTQLICPVDDAAHQLVGHVVPVVAFTAVLALAGRPLLDWSGELRRRREGSSDRAGRRPRSAFRRT